MTQLNAMPATTSRTGERNSSEGPGSELAQVEVEQDVNQLFSEVAVSQPSDSTDTTDRQNQPADSGEYEPDYKVDWLRVVPFIALHIACISVIWVGFSWVGLITAVVIMQIRMFGITAFYHRYFSHRTFKTSRAFQFVGAMIGASSAQRGPIWWAAHHRNHHKHSDEVQDAHSPVHHGFIWSHVGWFLNKENFKTDNRVVKDWLKYPELRWIDKWDFAPPLLLAGAMYGFGAFLESSYPALGTSGWQMVIWGFLISTIMLYHATYCVNSFAHIFGKRRFETKDDSRNNWWVALLTLGEGWHNNHHHYQNSTRQGFYWWEIDISYYTLKILSWFGIVWDLKPVPQHILEEGREKSAK